MTYVLVAGGGHCVSGASLIIVYAPNMYSNNGGFSVSLHIMEKRLRSKKLFAIVSNKWFSYYQGKKVLS